MKQFFAPNTTHPDLAGLKFTPDIFPSGRIATDNPEHIALLTRMSHIGVREMHPEPGVAKPSATILKPTVTTKEERQRRAMNETSKAMRRRHCEDAAGTFPWLKILSGKGVDVGAGNDPIQLPGCRPFDMHDGDANHLSRYIEKESLDYVHGSQVLEHMRDPRAALLDWSICVKHGGHLIVSCPDADLYESCIFPSRFNGDHRSTWSLWRRAHRNLPAHVYVPDFIKDMERHGLKCLLSKLCDNNFDYLADPSIDQTIGCDQAEAFIEMVFRKE